MDIIGSIFGKREPTVEHRTVDGGHAAPYPDMTDEQLYNYEVAFDLPKRTFDKPPVSRPSAQPDSAEPLKPPGPQPSAVHKPEQPEPPAILDLTRPVRTITTKQPVEIITTRARHPVYKVHGYIGDDDAATVFTADGRLSDHGLPFLENVPEKNRLHLNIYHNRDPYSRDRFLLTQHGSRQEADAAARPDRLACVEVQFG
jgi:hypothetical protein